MIHGISQVHTPLLCVPGKFPSTRFRKINITKKEQMIKQFAYLIVVRFNNIKCKYFNTFISQSKCKIISKGRYDNGRVISADYLEIVLTDLDFNFICCAYEFESYEFKEVYYSLYDYLPIEFVNFILDKYENKTKYKKVPGKESIYAIEKSKFNALYGMSVTNNIKDEVLFDNDMGWSEEKIDNEVILEKLQKEYKDGFLSFSYGVFITAWARTNLLYNIIKLDKYCVYRRYRFIEIIW